MRHTPALAMKKVNKKFHRLQVLRTTSDSYYNSNSVRFMSLNFNLFPTDRERCKILRVELKLNELKSCGEIYFWDKYGILNFSSPTN